MQEKCACQEGSFWTGIYNFQQQRCKSLKEKSSLQPELSVMDVL